MISFYSKAGLNFVLSFVFTLILAFIFSFFFPWWIILIMSFIVAVVFQQKPYKSFLSAFFALFILWGGLSIYLTQLNNNVLARVVSTMFFNAYIPYLMNLLSALLGGFIGGLGALVASHFVAIIKQKNPKSNENYMQAIRQQNSISPTSQVLKTTQFKTPEQIRTIAMPESAPRVLAMTTQKPLSTNAIKKEPIVDIKPEIKKPELAKKSQPINNISIINPKPKINILITKNNPIKNAEPAHKVSIKPAVKAPKQVPISVKKNQRNIPVATAPFKVPSIKEQTEKNIGLLKNKAAIKKTTK